MFSLWFKREWENRDKIKNLRANQVSRRTDKRTTEQNKLKIKWTEKKCHARTHTQQTHFCLLNFFSIKFLNFYKIQKRLD